MKFIYYVHAKLDSKVFASRSISFHFKELAGCQKISAPGFQEPVSFIRREPGRALGARDECVCEVKKSGRGGDLFEDTDNVAEYPSTWVSFPFES